MKILIKIELILVIVDFIMCFMLRKWQQIHPFDELPTSICVLVTCVAFGVITAIIGLFSIIIFI